MAALTDIVMQCHIELEGQFKRGGIGGEVGCLGECGW